MCNRYRIGQFASLLGMEADTIRYYEREGIITSKRDERNNYRYYTDTDCRAVLQCRALRSLGFSIHAMKEHSCSIQDKSFSSFLEKKEKDLIREEMYVRRVRECIQMCRIAAERIQNGTDTIWEENISGTYYYFRQTQETMLIPRPFADHVFHALLELMPLALQVGIYSRINLEQFHLACDEIPPFDCGLLIEKDDLANFCSYPFTETDADKIYSPGLCCRMVLKGTFEENELSLASLTPMYEYIRKRHYHIAGDGVGKILPSDPADKNWYILYSIPISKEP